MAELLNTTNKSAEFIYTQLNDILIDSNKIRHTIPYTIDSFDFNIINTPSSNIYLNNTIIDYINNYINYSTQLKFNYKNIFFTINIYTEKYINIINYFEKIQLAIICCLNNTNSFDYAINFTIDLFYTNLKKKWPSRLEPITSKHIGNGFSKFNENMYICIYREEEWLKSLIHELLYSFSLDLNCKRINFKNIFSKSFNINANFFIHDSIIEFWARIINIVFTIHYKKCKNTVEEFKTLLNHEKLFSIIQANNLLKIYDITYESITNKNIITNKLYKEKCNAFSSYVLTSILINDFDRTIEWMNINKSNIFNITKMEKDIIIFSYYIVSISKSKKITDIYKKNCHNNKSAKMTISN